MSVTMNKCHVLRARNCGVLGALSGLDLHSCTISHSASSGVFLFASVATLQYCSTSGNGKQEKGACAGVSVSLAGIATMVGCTSAGDNRGCTVLGGTLSAERSNL